MSKNTDLKIKKEKIKMISFLKTKNSTKKSNKKN